MTAHITWKPDLPGTWEGTAGDRIYRAERIPHTLLWRLSLWSNLLREWRQIDRCVGFAQCKRLAQETQQRYEKEWAHRHSSSGA